MIKRLVVKLLWIGGKLFSYLYAHKTSERIRLIKMVLYSAWISKEFKSFGKGSIIHSFSCLVGGKYIDIGINCSMGKNTVLTAWNSYGSDMFMPQISIGNNVSIGDDSHITAINRIEIGNNVLTGRKITITDNAHGKSNLESLSLPPLLRPLYSEGPVIIGNNVWIGDKVTILPNLSIGENAIIGANAVVTSDIPANCVAGGIPAKVIRIMKNN